MELQRLGSALILGVSVFFSGGCAEELTLCGEQYYYPSKYTCYNTDFLCPIENGIPTLKCGRDCYLPAQDCRIDGHLTYIRSLGEKGNSSTLGVSCSAQPATLHLSSSPYENYFYSDCHSASQVVVTSPNPDSNLSIIGPRVIVAWPAGNSGVLTYFAPANGINGTLGIKVVNSTGASPLKPIYESQSADGNATVGVSTLLEFNSSAVLSVAILGSIRTIRDFTEGPSLLYPLIQNAINYTENNGEVRLSRLWLDNITSTTISFSGNSSVQLSNSTVRFEPGVYNFSAYFDYPQLTQLSPAEVLSSSSTELIKQSPEQTTALSFLSYTSKLTAGAWRFLTYFGRDSMIAALLLEPVLSEGEGGAIEAVLAAVLERINRTDGSVCHEETIGDYATWLNLQSNVTSTAPLCDYKMIDTDYFLPVLMERYFVRNSVGRSRVDEFLGIKGSIFPENSNLTYKDLAVINANEIVSLALPFTAPGNQTAYNLRHLKEGQIVGEWRDSTYGIGGGRTPFDVNAALVPAALRSIASLSTAGILDFNSSLINSYAQIWEDSTLDLFEVTIDQTTAKSLVNNYTTNSRIPGLISQSNTIDSNVTFYSLALDGNNNLSKVAVMNTDDCFRHFLLNTTNQPQLTKLLNSTANNIRRTFPTGLMTNASLLIANPAYGSNPIYAANWTANAYHGTVVWSWPLAMMARGLELQLSRCISPSVPIPIPIPDFCTDKVVHRNVLDAYDTLWDSLDANSEHLSTEVWSWTYENGRFEYVDLGALPPPEGSSPTESNAVQLWSLTFLAVRRNEGFR